MESQVNWQIEEIHALIAIWAEDDIQRDLESSVRNERTYRDIASQLAKMGIMRTAKQCREKIKKLRHEYKKAKVHNNINGAGRKTFRWYDAMDAVLGQRQVTACGEKIDSQASLMQSCSDTEAGPTILEAEADADTEEEDPAMLTVTLDNTQFEDRKAQFEDDKTQFEDGKTQFETPTLSPVTKTEGRKRKTKTTATREFLDAMLLCNKQWLEKEQKISREEGEREAKLRREEMRQELALRREEGEREERLRRDEMDARTRDNELLASTLMQIATLLAKDHRIL